MVMQVRCAGCIWLLALVSYTGRHPQLLPKLPDVQEAFSHLLGDPTELTQEMASRGMSIVYSRGDDAMRNELLASLTGTLQGTCFFLVTSSHIPSRYCPAYHQTPFSIPMTHVCIDCGMPDMRKII